MSLGLKYKNDEKIIEERMDRRRRARRGLYRRAITEVGGNMYDVKACKS